MRMQTRRSALLLLAALGMLLMLAGCNQHTDKLSDIMNNPSGFANKDVTVAGEVNQVYELPLGIANVSAYRISDGTGQVWVVSRAGAPVKGDKVGLKGTVRPEGRFGGTLLGSIIEEKQRKVE